MPSYFPKLSHIAALLAFLCQPTPADLTIYVSPTGQDTHAGTTAAQPVATVARAVELLRQQRTPNAAAAPQPATIELAPGRYLIPASITLTPEDSAAASPLTIRAAQQGTAILSGAVAIPLTQFKPVTDPALLARLDAPSAPHIRMLPLAGMNLQHAGPYPPRFDDHGGLFELFDAAGRLPISRWPNTGSTTIDHVLTIGDAKTPGTFVYRGDRPSRWSSNPFVYLKGQWRVGWEDPAIRVAKIDPATRTITFAAGLSNGIGSKYHRPSEADLAKGKTIGSGKEPFAAINLIEEIDTPGEYAIDFATNTLFVYPRPGTTELLITQTTTPVITAKDLSHLKLEGLTINHSLGDGIVLENVSNTTVAGITVANIAGRGIVLHGTASTIQSCDISHIGQGAIYISGGDRKTLTKSGNQVLNNHLHHYGQLKRQYSAGVHVGALGNPAGKDAVRDAVGIRIAHNTLHHAPRDAFLYSGNDNLYEFNEVYYCGYDTADTGAFYSWLDWTMRGNIIRHNFIHNTIGGVNPDDGASGNEVYGNVFAGDRIGVWIASGPDNTIRHNIFIKPAGSVFGIDDRGTSRGYATNPRLINRVKELNPQSEPWLSAHPALATILDNRPDLPWRTKFIGNLIVNPKPAPTELKINAKLKGDTNILEERDNLTVPSDPGFVDMPAANYQLKPDSQVFQKIPGFQPIPFHRIGLQIDEYRRSLPDESVMQRGPQFSPYPKTDDKNYGT
jgi:hypothetical protein